MQMKGFDVVYLFCKFGINISLGAWVMALWLFHIRKIPYLREGACVTLKGHQSKLVWYVHHHHGWVYHWYNIYPFRLYEHFAIAGRKSFCEKTHFFAKIGFKCICDLDLCTYDKKIPGIIRILYPLLCDITFNLSIYFKFFVQAIKYRQYVKYWIYCYLFSWPWPLSKPEKIWSCI